MNTEDQAPVPDASGDQAGSPPTLGRRGQDLLAAIRRDARAAAGPGQPHPADALIAHAPAPPPEPADPIAAAFFLAADAAIDAEAAAIALARQLVAPAVKGRLPARGVGLLMLDPLGATLRLFTARNGAYSPVAGGGPQFRVANRSEWPVLLARLHGQARRLVVLDLTGRQHRLMPASTPTTVIVATTPDRAGRLAGYRRLKELDREGVGTIGLFFVEHAARPDAPPGDPGTEEAARREHETEVPQSSDWVPLAHRAQAAFTRLAETAAQFLGRSLVFFGVAHERGGQTVSAEMLGQRPSTAGQESRAELTCWLSEHGQAMSCGRTDDESAAPARRTSAVLALDCWPADEREMADLLARHGELLGTSLAAVAFHPPADPAAALAVRPAAGDSPPELVILRAAARDEEAATLAMLLASARWAGEHWPLLRLAHPQAALPPQPRVRLLLAGEQVDSPALRAAAAQGGVQLVRIRQVHLPAEADAALRLGLLALPVD